MSSNESTTSQEARQGKRVTVPFGTVQRRVWEDPILTEPSQRILYVYLLTCPDGSGSFTGMFRFHCDAAQDALGFSASEVEANMTALERAELIRRSGRWVWLVRSLDEAGNFSTTNAKHLLGIAKRLAEVPVELAQGFRERYPDACGSAPNPSPDPVPHPHPYPEAIHTPSDSPIQSPSGSPTEEDVRLVHDLWTKIPGKDGQPLTPRRRDAINAALKTMNREDVFDSIRWAKRHHSEIKTRTQGGGRFDEPAELLKFPDGVQRRATEWRDEEKAREIRERVDPNQERLRRLLLESGRYGASASTDEDPADALDNLPAASEHVH
jgi:hypothetical protein